MGVKLKIWLIVSGIIIIFISGCLWVLLGNPYPRIQLIGTSYVEDSDELQALSNQQRSSYLLIKKYKYSKYIWLTGFTNGDSRTDDYYGLGIADKDKNEILPPIYNFIYIKYFNAKEVYIRCVPYRKTGYEPDEYYKIENNKAILLENEKF